jgi:hypothetical protein
MSEWWKSADPGALWTFLAVAAVYFLYQCASRLAVLVEEIRALRAEIRNARPLVSDRG